MSDPQSRIRNFCVIAHVDHGKTTLSDRLIELTGTVALRQMRDQLLDSMELEREKGVTIKARAVRMAWTGRDGEIYELNLIDTPGHVDFNYEVSRSLARARARCSWSTRRRASRRRRSRTRYLAIEQGLEVIPVINKIDLPSIDLDDGPRGPTHTLGVQGRRDPARIGQDRHGHRRSAGSRSSERVPPPSGDPTAPLRALIFDCHYDTYKGVVAYVRVMDGRSAPRTASCRWRPAEGRADVRSASSRPTAPITRLDAGEVGYVATGLKTVRDCRVGDTITLAARSGRGSRFPVIARRSRWSSRASTRSDGGLSVAEGRAREAAAERRLADLRAGDVAGAQLRFSLWLPRTVSYGDHSGASRA